MLAAAPGRSATVEVALATIAGWPRKIRVGKVRIVPPPAIAFIPPATNEDPRRAAIAAASMSLGSMARRGVRRSGRLLVTGRHLPTDRCYDWLVQNCLSVPRGRMRLPLRGASMLRKLRAPKSRVAVGLRLSLAGAAIVSAWLVGVPAGAQGGPGEIRGRKYLAVQGTDPQTAPGLSGWTIYLDANDDGVLDPG